jgi:hypothetical protein
MSSSKIRKEKNCLNCNAIVHSKFCSECGQLNSEPNISLKELLHDFLHDLTHFDGKFFATSKYLIFKPGFLSTEFMRGRRASYLHPVRLYVFTSAIFFYLFFNFFVSIPENEKVEAKPITATQLVEKLNEVDTSKNNKFRLDKSFILRSKHDTIANLNKTGVLKKLTDSIAAIESSNAASSLSLSFSDKENGKDDQFKSVESYVHFQDSIPKAQRDGYFKRFIQVRGIKIKQYFDEYKDKAFLKIFDQFIHSFTAIMFISLPLIAMILSMLFYRRKDHSYVGNGIFLLHLYVFTFFFTFLILLISNLTKSFNNSFFEILNFIIFLLIIFYGYKSMKNYFNLTSKKALFKYTIFLFLSSFTMACLFILNFIITLFKI